MARSLRIEFTGALHHKTSRKDQREDVLFSDGNQYKIKKIAIEPGKRLSLQYHHHRSEHWIVVKGTALVTVDDKEIFVHEGESIFVPKNSHHRLANPGKIPLEIRGTERGVPG